MSKIKETLAKICSTIAIVPIASLAFIACTTNKDNGKNNNDSADNTSNISNPRPTPDPTPGDDINDENKEIHSLNGLYSFKGNFDVNDIVYEDETELVNFFKTKDLNGAKKAAVRLGFYDFVDSIMKHEGEEISVLFPNQEYNGVYSFSYVVKTSDLSYKIFDTEQKHTYTITESGYETSNDEPIIMFDNINNEVTLLYQFCYTDENDKLIETPMFFKTVLSYNEYTDGIGVSDKDASAYLYKTDSSFLNISENHVKYDNMLAEVAKRLEITENPTPEKISEFFSNNNIAFVIDYKLNRLYYALHEDMSMHIVPINKNTNTYDFFGFSFSIFATNNENEIRLSANLDSEVKFEITLTELALPDVPEIPEQPEVPVEPETPENPEVPVNPETPEQPESPVEPETSEETTEE